MDGFLTISCFGYLQAFWRGFTLRRRLAFALAAVTCPDVEEDDTFEEVDVEELVFDEVCSQVCVFIAFMVQSFSIPHPSGEKSVQYLFSKPLSCPQHIIWYIIFLSVMKVFNVVIILHLI